jgi:hypothetical protein
MSVSQIFQNDMYIEKLPNIAILHVPNGYRNIFNALKVVCCWRYLQFLKVDFMQKNSSNQKLGLDIFKRNLVYSVTTHKFIFLLSSPLKSEFFG